MSDSSQRITKTTIAALAHGEEIRDSQLRGFGARRQAGGVSYFVHTRVNGRLRRITIGKHGSPFTPETARKEASRLLLTIRGGDDPTAKRRAQKAAKITVAQAATAFFADHGRKLKPRTLLDYQSLFRHLIAPRMGKLAIAEVGFKEVAAAHAAWSRTPRQANHALAFLSKFLNWCEDSGYRAHDKNPCSKIRRYKENKRDRYLTPDELARLGEVLADAARDNTINRYMIAAFRLLLLTGARRMEILTLKWSYIDLERRRIHLPDSKTGQKTLILRDAAIEVLRGIGRTGSNPYVLPGAIDGSHLQTLHRAWWTIRKAAGLDDVRVHDLRHSFAAFAVDVGGSLPVIGRLLGHLAPQTTARYAHVAPNPADQLALATDRLISAKLLPRPATPAASMFRRRSLRPARAA